MCALCWILTAVFERPGFLFFFFFFSTIEVHLLFVIFLVQTMRNAIEAASLSFIEHIFHLATLLPHLDFSVFFALILLSSYNFPFVRSFVHLICLYLKRFHFLEPENLLQFHTILQICISVFPFIFLSGRRERERKTAESIVSCFCTAASSTSFIW